MMPSYYCCVAVIFAFLSVQRASCDSKSMTAISNENWTSCDEFLHGTTFDPLRVIDIDWQIFYFWNIDTEDGFHVKFSLPSKLLIDRFRVELDDEIKPAVNWKEADLFMETSIDISGLLIKTNTSGEYRLISSMSFQYTVTSLRLTFGLKVVEPGYLGLMNCKHRLCYAFAPVNKMPESAQIPEAARSIGFDNPFGHSYLLKAELNKPPPSLEVGDDADDDLQLEIDREINSLKVI